MKIAILCTSNDTSHFAKKYITDDIKYIHLLAPLAPLWQFDCFPVWQDNFPQNIAQYQGFIITGSPASIHDKEPWIQKLLLLILSMHSQKIPMFGACFGHQAIALALGGSVATNKKNSWSFGKEITKFHKNAPFGLADTPCCLYSVHKEEVTELPKDAKSIGTNPFCSYPSFVIGQHIFTTQYHPEMTQDFLIDLTHELKTILPPSQQQKAIQQFKEGHQGSLFAHAIVRFFEDAQ